MILIVKTFFPRSSVHQAAKTFTQLPKVPATVKRQGPYFHFDDQGQISSTSIYSFSDQNISNEDKKFVEKRLKLFTEVPGFSYSIETWLNMEEALVALNK